ncbi:hypothetical protein CPB85DRAFT_1321567 [Mucidula mucida]|nr:hypothetical protein CPB85DRAFT_1321567 [Mucidula mucida]
MSLPLWSKRELRKGQFRTEMASYLPPSSGANDFLEHIYAHRVLCELGKDEDMKDCGMDGNMDEGEDAVSRSDPLAYDRDKEIDYAFWFLLNDAIQKYGFAARDVYNTILSIPHEILMSVQSLVRHTRLSRRCCSISNNTGFCLTRTSQCLLFPQLV